MNVSRISIFAGALGALAGIASSQVIKVNPETIDPLDPTRVQVAGLRCGTPAFAEFLDLAESPSDCSYNSTSILSQYDPTFVYEIPVVFHIIQHGNGNGNISNAQVQSQIDVLNEDFGAIGGSNGAGGYNTMIQFKLAEFDPSGNPTNGITRTTNNTWYNDGGSYWNSLAWDTNRYLNIYSNSASGALGYVPSLPQGGGLVGTNSDRVVLLWSSVGKNAPLFPYHQGRTGTHEVGHYLGLFHTFDFGCGTSSAPGCNTSGDRVCDTNSESGPVFGCPGSSNSCGSSDPYNNYMDYSDDLCMTGFTPNQSNRMRCTLENWRPNLASACAVLADEQFRNSGSNPSVYSANAPVNGATLSLAVDLSVRGHAFALVIGYNSQLDVPLSGGQQLLVNIGDPAGDLLGLAPKFGPMATWDIPVVTAPGTCGLEIYSQALMYGGVFPFGLSNARDLTVGL